MTASIEVAIDALDADAVATWWGEALGYRRLYERPPFVVLGPHEGDERPRLVVQQVEAIVGGKTPVHLDLRVDDPDAEVDRMRRRGAAVAWTIDDRDADGSVWTTMTDPWGMLFCVCPARDAAASARSTAGSTARATARSTGGDEA